MPRNLSPWKRTECTRCGQPRCSFSFCTEYSKPCDNCHEIPTLHLNPEHGKRNPRYPRPTYRDQGTLGQPTRYPRPIYTKWANLALRRSHHRDGTRLHRGRDGNRTSAGGDGPAANAINVLLPAMPSSSAPPPKSSTAYCTSPSSSPTLPNLDHKWRHITTSPYFTHTATPTPKKNPVVEWTS